MYTVNEEDYQIIKSSIEECSIILERIATIDASNNMYFNRFMISNDDLFAINEAVNQIGLIFDEFGTNGGDAA